MTEHPEPSHPQDPGPQDAGHPPAGLPQAGGQGIDGGIALVLAIFVAFVLAFVTPAEVGNLYQRRGQHTPVTAITGLWILLPLLGGLIWFVKTNGALNSYWRSLGAR